jgi:hypothetical protein
MASREFFDKVAYVVFLALLLALVFYVVYYDQDWDYICNSWWRFAKPYMIACVEKGYPVFGK